MTWHILAFHLACHYAEIGEAEKIYHYIQTALNTGKTSKNFEASEFDPYRHEQKFVDLMYGDLWIMNRSDTAYYEIFIASEYEKIKSKGQINMSKRFFIYEDEKSSKFWNIEIEEDCFTVTYGKIGTDGQEQTKEFDDEEKCMKEAEKLINSKLKKGYTEVDGEDGGEESGGPVDAFASRDLAKVEVAIFEMAEIVKKRYKEWKHPLLKLFGVQDDYDEYDEGPIDLPELDEFMENNAETLSDKALMAVLGMTLKSCEQEFTSATLAFAEVIRRGDVKMQIEAVKILIKSMDYYDAGHSFGCLIYDVLVQELMPQLEAEPFCIFFEEFGNDYFDPQYGEMSGYAIAPAFKKAEGDILKRLEARVINLFFGINDDYPGKFYTPSDDSGFYADLYEQITPYLSDDGKQKLKEAMDKIKG